MYTRLNTALVIAAFAGMLVAAPAEAATKATRYSPFTAEGELRSSLRPKELSKGHCQTRSNRVGGPDVYRCGSGDSVFDPCFYDADEKRVACVEAPWKTKVFVFRVSLANYFNDPIKSRPWGLILMSGTKCIYTGGLANYSCGDGSFLFGWPDKSKPTWTIRQASDRTGAPKHKVRIRRAWL